MALFRRPRRVDGVDEESVDRVTVRLVAKLAVEDRVLEQCGAFLRAIEDGPERDLATAYLHHQVLAFRAGDGERDPAGTEQFETLVGDAKGVHGVLGVVAVLGGQLPGAGCVSCADQSAALRVDIAQERSARTFGEERRRERLELLAERISFEDVFAIDE